jgi:hypothetical protein
MKRSLPIAIVAIVMGLLLIPAVIHAQSDQATADNPGADNSAIEYLQGCEVASTDKHSFIVKLHDVISSILEKVKAEITDSGGRFEGNAKCGRFQGKSILGLIKGGYRSISDTEVEITIERKPFILPYSTIESKIKEHFS